MPADLFYSTGQAARELAVSPATLRALCAADAIDHQTTAGGQYRVAKSVVEKLKRDGLPAVPRPLPGDNPRPVRPRHGHAALLDEPSEDAKAAADEVVVLENEVRSLGLRRQKEEGLDWFREREQTAAERLAAQDAAERAEQTRAAAAQNRRYWLERWTDYALDLVPRQAPREIRLDVAEAVRRTLDPLDCSQPDTTTERLIDGAVARGCASWQRGQEVERAIQEACSRLPFQMQWGDDWKSRAQQAAGEAIARLRDGASSGEMEAAASLALKLLITEYEHGRRSTEAVEGVWQLLPGGSPDEWEHAKEALREVLAELPTDARQRQIDVATEEALAPIREAIASRKEEEMRAGVVKQASWNLTLAGIFGEAQQEALQEIKSAIDELPQGTQCPELERARDKIIERYKRDNERETNKQRVIEAGLQEISAYLRRLEQKWEFDKSTWTLEQELKPAIREALAEELEGDESPEDVARIVRRLVREELGLR